MTASVGQGDRETVIAKTRCPHCGGLVAAHSQFGLERAYNRHIDDEHPDLKRQVDRPRRRSRPGDEEEDQMEA